jgi:hypothetical protein
LRDFGLTSLKTRKKALPVACAADDVFRLVGYEADM